MLGPSPRKLHGTVETLLSSAGPKAGIKQGGREELSVRTWQGPSGTICGRSLGAA